MCSRTAVCAVGAYVRQEVHEYQVGAVDSYVQQ